MKENTQEKELVQINKNSIFYKIKQFLKSLFHKKQSSSNDITETNMMIWVNGNTKNKFIEEIKNIEDEEILILKLQKQYRRGTIKEEELTEKQINSLCELYDKQIANLKKSNEIRKRRLLERGIDIQIDKKDK